MAKALIEKIEPGSIAEKYGLRAGDAILSVNGIEINDTLDYMMSSCKRKLTLAILRNNAEFEIKIRKEEDQPLGIVFSGVIFDKIKTCKNNCKFCFVMQGPPDARETMKIKDDDFRLSFMWGNFISLTNFTDEEWQKIKNYRLSPLYISVHATNPKLRSEIFQNPAAAKIMEQLKTLSEMGISMHTQIVLCPGINDGDELERTISDLSSLYPSVQSIAAVPVGITKYHTKGILPFKKHEMKKIINLISRWQKKLITRHGENFLYISDEFYIKTASPIPPSSYYGDYPQIENGIGMMRLFMTDFNRSKRFIPEKIAQKKEITIITGKLAHSLFEEVTRAFKKTTNLKINVIGAESVFWGPNVDVAGLLTGEDIINALKTKPHHSTVLIPSHCLRDDIYFLDGKTIGDAEKECGCTILPVDPDYKSLKNAILN